AEPSVRVGGAEHGFAVEPGGAGAAHRPRPSARAAGRGTGRELRGGGGPRGRHARRPEGQDLAVPRPARRARSGRESRRRAGGEADVNLGGTRLRKFMETVEATTAGLPAAHEPEAEAAEAADATGARREFNGKAIQAAGERSAAGPSADAWGGLLRAGAALLQ